MKTHEELKKRCPACKRTYPEENKYCGTDGSALEVIDHAVSDLQADKERIIESARSADKSV